MGIVSTTKKEQEELLEEFLNQEGAELNFIEQEQALLYDELMQRRKDQFSDEDKAMSDENKSTSVEKLDKEIHQESTAVDDTFKKGSNKENYEKKREISESDEKALGRLLELGQGAFDRTAVLRAYDMAKRNETDAASLLFLGEF